MNRIVYPLRYFGSMSDSKVSAELQFWLEDGIYYRKYLCRECGYRYLLGIPRLEIEETADPECPVAMIYPEEQRNCTHIFGNRADIDQKPILIRKFRAMGNIRVWEEAQETLES